MKQKEWADILPNKFMKKTTIDSIDINSANNMLADCLIALECAEKDGLICRNEKRMKQKSKAENFADSIKDNPDEIIAWANREIKEYQKLINIIEAEIVKSKDVECRLKLEDVQKTANMLREKNKFDVKLPKNWGKLR